jgi:hypothetical protein
VSDYDPIRLDHDGVLQRLHALVGTFVDVRIDGVGPSVGFPDAPPGFGFPIAWFGGTLLVGNPSPLDARTEDEVGGIDFWVGDRPEGDGVDFAWGVATLSGFQLSRDTFEEGIAEATIMSPSGRVRRPCRIPQCRSSTLTRSTGSSLGASGRLSLPLRASAVPSPRPDGRSAVAGRPTAAGRQA